MACEPSRLQERDTAVPNPDTTLPAPKANPSPHSSNAELQVFERLLAELSAGFIGLAAGHIDAAIEDALRRIVLMPRVPQQVDLDAWHLERQRAHRQA